jgi:phthiodiolone/phenolphthiodiolone dimycocerosates ketoreductase
LAQPRIAVGLALPPKPPVGTLKQVLFAARLMRFDAFMLWDHFQDIFPSALWERGFTWLAGENASPHEFFDYQTFLGYLAARAGRVRLGVAVTDPIRRHPAVIAQAMLTLAYLAKRAPILGIGAGERMHIDPYGLDFSGPVGRLEEALQVIRLCFASSDPVSFEGKHFRLDHAVMGLRPPRGRTPEIWVGALGPRMLRLTGRYGDGWYPLGMLTPDEYAASLEVVRAAAREAGRDPDAIMPSLQPYVIVARTEKEARRLMDEKVIRFFGLLVPAEHWRRLGYTHPFGDDFRGILEFLPERHARQELEDAIAKVPTELAEVGLISGTPAQVAARLREYGEAGMRHVVPQLMSAAVSRKDAYYGLWALRSIARSLRG